MDRIWQWAWDRYGPRYSWAICAISLPSVLLAYVCWSSAIVTLKHSDRYLEAAVVSVIAAPVLVYLVVLPGTRRSRVLEQWAAGEIDRARALETPRPSRRRRRHASHRLSGQMIGSRLNR